MGRVGCDALELLSASLVLHTCCFVLPSVRAKCGLPWAPAEGQGMASGHGFSPGPQWGLAPAAWPSRAMEAAHVSLFPLQFLCRVKSVRDQSCIPCEEMVGTATSRRSLELVPHGSAMFRKSFSFTHFVSLRLNGRKWLLDNIWGLFCSFFPSPSLLSLFWVWCWVQRTEIVNEEW